MPLLPFASAPSSGGGVSSVTNSDGSLTISPTTGSTVASLNVAHANTWTATETFSGQITVQSNAVGIAIISNGNNGMQLMGGSLSPGKNNWNIKQGSDGTFLFDQGGGMSGRFKLGGASAGTYFDWTPDYSSSYFKVNDNKVISTFNNTLDDGSGNITVAGKINITTGSNKTAGTGTLSGGTVTISTTAVTSSSLIFLQDTASSITNVGTLTVSAKTAGTSFVVTSTLALDTSTFNWLIIN